ncbi:hypothetical protein [Bdellovibrio sp. HCB337]|uniref:hypothetical protein n=1 Tax=Bdellovibrio sp. HCB337 TaxID=3394358 RepID=UPI0039A42F46
MSQEPKKRTGFGKALQHERRNQALIDAAQDDLNARIPLSHRNFDSTGHKTLNEKLEQSFGIGSYTLVIFKILLGAMIISLFLKYFT